MAEIDTTAAQQLSNLIGQGIPQPIAKTMVDMAAGQARAEAQLEAERAILLPAAKRESASRIATQFSTKTVTISPDELVGEGTVDAMRVKAQTIANERRTSAYTQRQQKGTDKVEGASIGAVDSKAIQALDPFSKIKLGLIRGG
jgi:hypothetical protein